MSAEDKDLPAVPATVDGQLRRVLEPMREAVQRLMGKRGADGRAAVLWDDLAADGLAISSRRRLLIVEAIKEAAGSASPGTGGDGGPVYVPDLTKPPTPTGLNATAGISSVLIEWGAPVYSAGHGHKQTNIYATKQPAGDETAYTFANAVRVDTAPGALTLRALTSDPNIKWRIWIKWESVDGVESDPAGGAAGVVVTTGQDVANLLAVLNQQISSSQLATALATKISLIDAPSTTAGSVNARVKTETDARVAAIAQEVADRNTAIATGVNTAKAYTESWGYSKAATDSAIASAGTSIRTDFAAADATTLAQAQTYTVNYTYAKSAVDGALSSMSSSLTSAFTTADTATLNSAKTYADGAISTYAYSKTAVDGAISSLSSTVTAAYTSADTANFNSAKAYADAGDTTTLANAKTYTNATVASYAYSKAEADSAVAESVNQVAAKLTTAGAAAVFRERWEAANAASLWVVYAGSGERSVQTVTDGAVGSKVLRVGNNAGNDQAWLIHTSRIAFDPSKLYRITAKVRRLNGTGSIYVGWAGVASDGVTLVSASGGNNYYGQHYHAAAGDPGTGWKTYVGYTRGFGATAGTGGVGTESSPGRMHPSVRYLAPLLLVNYENQPGITEVGMFDVEDITDTADAKAYADASVQSYAYSKAQTDSAIATSTNTVSARLNSGGDINEAIVQAQSTATAAGSVGTHLSALYTLRVQLTQGGRTVVGGFGISGSASGSAGPTIDFGVSADKFWIGAPEGSTGVSDVQPFVVQTTDQTVNGVLVPKGVYMDAAYIKNVTAIVARLGNAWIDDAKISSLSAAKLTAGDGTVGGTLKSTNYVGGSSGWIVRPDGYLEASGAVIRGTVYASAGSIGGNLLGSDYIQSATFGAGTGWQLKSNGTGQIGGITVGGTNVRAGQTAYDTGTGFYLGADGRFSLGKSDGAKLTFDPGTNTLTVSGNVTAKHLDAATGTFAGELSSKVVRTDNLIEKSVSNLETSYISTDVATTITSSQTLDLVSVDIDVVRGECTVWAGASLQATATTTTGGPTATVNVRIEVVRDGAVIGSMTAVAASSSVEGSGAVRICTLPPIVDDPGPGLHTYILRAVVSMSAAGTKSFRYYDRGIAVMETKA